MDVMEEPLVDSSGSSIIDAVLHYGLLLGAVFQLICIFAVVLIPSKDTEKDETEEDQTSKITLNQPRSPQENLTRRHKQDRKKRK